MAKLLFKNGSDTAEKVDVGSDEITIGRQIGNVIVLQDDKVSRFHAIVERKRGLIGVRDLGSRNGTLVNGERVKATQLKHGDVLQIGRISLKFVGDEEAEKSANAQAAKDLGVEFGEEDDSKGGKMDVAQTTKELAKTVSQLPSRNVKPGDMKLLNARGRPALERKDGDGPPAEAVTILRLVLLVCFRTGASDIHLEPSAEEYTMRVRIDGTMVDLAKLPKAIGIRFATLIKVLCDADIAKKDVVQEGSFACKLPDRRVDYRVSLTPSLYGQKLVIRVLDSANAPGYLWDLGLGEVEFAILDRVTRRNEGMMLVAGPTGSGKSSSLYAVLRSIDSKERSVVTIEDPVEIRLGGINQIPVNEDQGNTFSALLRSVLRQDPDVILVGEIRDNATAETAVQASMTGHLVLSTVHARDSVSAVFRLMDLGVEAYQAASGLQTIVSQRLVRTLCDDCKKVRPMTAVEKQLSGFDFEKVYDSVGCKKCLNTGFVGRRAVFEVLNITEEIRDAIIAQKEASDLYMTLKKTGFRRLKDSVYDLVQAGKTSLEEADRVVGN